MGVHISRRSSIISSSLNRAWSKEREKPVQEVNDISWMATSEKGQARPLLYKSMVVIQPLCTARNTNTIFTSGFMCLAWPIHEGQKGKGSSALFWSSPPFFSNIYLFCSSFHWGARKVSERSLKGAWKIGREKEIASKEKTFQKKEEPKM